MNLITVNELAEYLQIHPMTVYRYARAGVLEGIRVGGGWRFDKDRIDSQLDTLMAL